jgi:energy-converting hydrogenase Eha subunit G
LIHTSERAIFLRNSYIYFISEKKKYDMIDMEPMSLTLHERTTSLLQFLVRLAGMVGGIVVCTGWTFRLVDRLVQKVLPGMVEEEDPGAESYSPLPLVSPHAVMSSSNPGTRKTYNT